MAGAWIITGAGLVEPSATFARAGDGFLITATRPLGGAGEQDRVDADGEAPEGDRLAARDADARGGGMRPGRGPGDLRTHSPGGAGAGARQVAAPVLVSAGWPVKSRSAAAPTWSPIGRPGADLRRSRQRDCLLIRGNGSIATGRSLAERWSGPAIWRKVPGRSEGLGRRKVGGPTSWIPVPDGSKNDQAWAWMRWRYGGEK